MILQALHDYYERKRNTGELAPEGFAYREIPFVIVLTPEGKFFHLDDTRTKDKKRLVAKTFLIPQERERSGSRAYETSNVLWDHYGYVLAHPKSDAASDVEMAERQAQSFTALAKRVATSAPNDATLTAVCAFLDSEEERCRVFNDPAWSECRKTPGCNLSFRLTGNNALACQASSVKAFLEYDDPPGNDEDGTDLPAVEGLCLISGTRGVLARTHPRTPISGSKSNAKLVSFQKHSGFDSYGKEQSYNAPISEDAAFTYTTALKHLLRKGSRQRLQVGDASTVFWAADNSGFEDEFAAMFGAGDRDDPDRGTQAVRGLFEATKTGVYLNDDSEARFYVLGLAPNAARIAIRFWQIDRVAGLAIKIAKHFDDLKLVDDGRGPGFLSINALLASVARETKDGKKPNAVYWRGKYYDVPADLAGDTMRAILTGLSYPAMLLQGAVGRCRAEQAKRDKQGQQEPNVPYPRAAIIKAVLNRLIRTKQLQVRKLTMSLDKSNRDVPYLLGRLFAAFERLQQDAHRSDSGTQLNRTIRESYYGSASSSPSSAFPVLVRLHQHHLSKLDKAGHGAPRRNYRKLLGEIFDDLPALRFPRHLSLPEQGLFAIGYYQQQQDFFKGKPREDFNSPQSDNGEQQQ